MVKQQGTITSFFRPASSSSSSAAPKPSIASAVKRGKSPSTHTATASKSRQTSSANAAAAAADSKKRPRGKASASVTSSAKSTDAPTKRPKVQRAIVNDKGADDEGEDSREPVKTGKPSSTLALKVGPTKEDEPDSWNMDADAAGATADESCIQSDECKDVAKLSDVGDKVIEDKASSKSTADVSRLGARVARRRKFVIDNDDDDDEDNDSKKDMNCNEIDDDDGTKDTMKGTKNIEKVDDVAYAEKDAKNIEKDDDVVDGAKDTKRDTKDIKIDDINVDGAKNIKKDSKKIEKDRYDDGADDAKNGGNCINNDNDEMDEENDNDDVSNAESDNEADENVKASAAGSGTKPSKPTARLDLSRLATKRTWKDGSPVPYKFVTDAFAKVEEISGRLEIQAILTQLFRDIIVSTPNDLVPTIYLCINKLAPAHHGIELGIGESILIRALSQVTGQSIPALKTTYKKVGDLGDVASAARTKQKTMFPLPPLTVRKVFAEFKAIALISGKNTQDAKRSRIVKMLVAASKGEAKYIARALLGKLRIHLADKTVIASLAAAVTLEKRKVSTDVLLTVEGKKKTKMSQKEEAIEEAMKEAMVLLNSVYSQLPVWDIIVPKLLEFSVVDDRLVKACKLIPGVPVSPMLAKPTKAISEVLERFAEHAFTCEFKYDGERAQVHRLENGSMKVYSRNAEDLTPKYPDLVRDLPKTLKSDFCNASFIIDAEAVAYDTEKKQILPFQELQSRKRKDVNADEVKVKVCIFAFDLLFFNGESQIGKSLRERREQLLGGFDEREGQFMFAKGHDSRDPEQIMELLNESVKAGCEGLMVKAIEGENATYEPANRSQNWLKVKKDYLEGCGDSLDLVPIGGYVGRGKRAGIFGAFLLACYDPETEEYQSICKIGTGFSEVDLESFAKFYKDGEEEERVSNVAKSYFKTPNGEKLAPDVWFEPVQVWEVKCADLSISPQHMAGVGHVDQEKGIALRFPRFLRVREDKKPEEATSAEQVAEMYLRQSSVANNA